MHYPVETNELELILLCKARSGTEDEYAELQQL